MVRIKTFLIKVATLLGRVVHQMYPMHRETHVTTLFAVFNAFRIIPGFKSAGISIKIGSGISLIGAQYISFGDNVYIGKNMVLTAWDKHGNQTFTPEIVIGNNTQIGRDCHITAIDSIKIGDNVLMGMKITITDNSHGKAEFIDLKSSPSERHLYSRGEVVVGNSVWIGDKATILPGVKIGENSIIGANSVVTKDVPRNCVVVGNPARIIKNISER